jgi:hypothetical protein
MPTFKHISDTIHIDEIRIPMNIFRILEPDYRTCEGLESMFYDGTSLTVRASGTTNTQVGSWTDGDRYISRKQDFIALMNDVNRDVDVFRDPIGCRLKEYPHINDLVVALWEHLVEKKTTKESGIEELQLKRIAVKDKYPVKEKSNASDQLSGETEGLLPKGTRRTRSRNKSSR